MKPAWPAAVGVSLMLLAPAPCAAQDDGGPWEGRIEYNKYIGISSHEGHRSERTASSGNGVRVVSSSSHDIDRYINGKLTVSIWMSKGRTTVVVTGHSVWIREDDTRRTGANGAASCDGEQLWFFSDTAFRDDDAGASVSMDEANRFTISSNGTGLADASAEIDERGGSCVGFLKSKIPPVRKRLDQPWSVALSGVSKSRNAITLNYKTEGAIPLGADGKSAAPWFYELLDEFMPPLSDRLLGSTSAFTYEDVKVDLKRRTSDPLWTGTFTANCQNADTVSSRNPTGGSLEGTQSNLLTSSEKLSVNIDLPADGGAPVAQVVYHSTLRTTVSMRAKIKCGVLGWMNGEENWKPYNSDEDTSTTIAASGQAVPTVKVEVDRRTLDGRRTGVAIAMTISVSPVEGLQNTTHKKTFNGGCGGKPTAEGSDVDDDALSPSFDWFRGVNNATPDTVSGSLTEGWARKNKFGAFIKNGTCTYEWNFKSMKREQGR